MNSHATRRQFLISTAFCAAAPNLAFSQQAKKSSGLVKYGKSVTYRGRHTCIIDKNGSDLSHLEIWVPVATDWSEQQVATVQIGPEVATVTAENGSTQVARWIFTNETAAESGRLVVETQWKRSEIITDLKRLRNQKFQPYDEESEDYQRYIGREEKIESQDEEIVTEAQKFQGKDRPWAHIAYDIYSWVIDRTTYSRINWIGAKACYAEKRGACGDYSALFVAACRAVGIPARINAGYWAVGKDDLHVWGEFLLPTGEWVPVDASVGDHGDAAKHKNFGYLDNNRITLSKTADVILKPIDDSQETVDLLQSGAYWWKGQGNVRVKFEFVGEKAGK
jgi:hypothetical protein